MTALIPTLTETLRETALAYVALGWRVHPLRPRDKRPLLSDWPTKASSDPLIILAWWDQWPEANIGIATGAQSGIFVLDIDPDKDGPETLAQLQDAHGPLPDTATCRTGSGGLHGYFRYPGGVLIRNSAGKLGPGLDIRGEGGYVVAPPSLHPNGRPYEWQLDPWENDLAEAPGWLLGLLAEATRKASPGGNGTGKIPAGQRNTWLTSEAGRMRRAGLDEAAILAALSALNYAKCAPPLPENEVQQIARSVARYAPGYALSDAGNAEFFADGFAGQVCYRHDTQRWYLFRAPVWRPDRDGEVERLALEAIRERQAQAVAIQDIDLKKRTLSFLLASESTYRVRSVLELARSRPQLARSGQEFDRHPTLLAVHNGVLELTGGLFREGHPDDYLTQCTGTAYDPKATCPRWEQFVGEIFDGDAELVAFVQRAIGYTLTGWTREQCFFFCYGTGRNGKSTLFKVLRALLGDYAHNTAFATFARDRTQASHQEDLMALEGARLVTASESKMIGQLADDMLKTIAGEDPITGSRKFQHERTYQPTFKVWLAANNLPRVNDVTEGFWRKVILLPFHVRFEGARDDKHLGEKLLAELPGILNWALAGCLAYQREGLNPPARCRDAAEAWRADNDPLHDFLKTCQVGANLEVKASALFAAYEQFCQREGVPQVVKSAHAFTPLVQAHGFTREKRKNGRFFVGISL